jgi:hypothetical protein
MILISALLAVEPITISVNRDELMQLCMAFRYNAYLIEEDDRLRRAVGDHDEFLGLLAPSGP